MSPLLFGRGIVFGLAMAAPVGPIGLLVIRRTLAEGRRHGFVSGLGAATADGCYGLVAALGVTVVSDVVARYRTAVGLVAAVVLVALGVRIATTRPATGTSVTAAPRRLRTAYLSTVALTLANPATILSFTAVFAALTAGTGGRLAGLVVAAGVACGSALWWLLLTGVAGFARRGIGPRGLRRVNVASGSLIAGLGVLSAVSG